MSRRTRSKRSLGAGSKSVFALTLLVPRDTVSVKPCIMIILSVKLLRREEKDSIPEQTLLNYAEKRVHVRTRHRPNVFSKNVQSRALYGGGSNTRGPPCGQRHRQPRRAVVGNSHQLLYLRESFPSPKPESNEGCTRTRNVEDRLDRFHAREPVTITT